MDTKYSKASDVWSFGVLVYEVMTLGQLPYCEFATLAEAAEQIKAGYVMPCPDVCHNDVHTSVMLPCWSRNPSDRPGFGTLCEVLVQHGAIPAQVANASSATTSVEPPTKGSRKKWSKTKITKADRLLLGPSIHHIQNVLAPRVIAAVQPPWRDGKGQMVLPECATIAHAVAAVVKPAGAKTVCPRDGQMGAAYVDTLRKQENVGRACALLSYTWHYKVVSVGQALERWAEQSGRDLKQTYVWVCSLCLNQHRMTVVVSPEDLAAEFGPRVTQIGRILPMLEPWRNPGQFLCEHYA